MIVLVVVTIVVAGGTLAMARVVDTLCTLMHSGMQAVQRQLRLVCKVYDDAGEL